MLFERFGRERYGIVRWMSDARPRDFASLAPTIVEHARQGDATACELMRSAAAHIDTIAARLRDARVFIACRSWAALRTAFCPSFRIRHEAASSQPRGDALDGALHLARAEAAGVAHMVPAPKCIAVSHGCPRRLKPRPKSSRGRRMLWRSLSTHLLARLRRQPPSCVVTCARGSSAHAATLGKHLIERYLGLPVAAAAPSIASIYRQRTSPAQPARPRHLAVREK